MRLYRDSFEGDHIQQNAAVSMFEVNDNIDPNCEYETIPMPPRIITKIETSMLNTNQIKFVLNNGGDEGSCELTAMDNHQTPSALEN